MKEMDTNVDYHTGTTNIGKLFEGYTYYIVDSTEYWQQFQRELAITRAKKRKYSISTKVLNNERKEEQRLSVVQIRWVNGSASSSNEIGLVIFTNTEGEISRVVN